MKLIGYFKIFSCAKMIKKLHQYIKDDYKNKIVSTFCFYVSLRN